MNLIANLIWMSIQVHLVQEVDGFGHHPTAPIHLLLFWPGLQPARLSLADRQLSQFCGWRHGCKEVDQLLSSEEVVVEHHLLHLDQWLQVEMPGPLRLPRQ